MSGQKATTIATNYIQFSSFSWAFTWYHSGKEVCGSQSYIFKNLKNYFLKLLCLLKKHEHCQVGKTYQFLTINQLKIQITESFKSLSPQFNGATCQEVSTKAFESCQKCPLYYKIGTWRRNCCQKQVGGLGPFGPALKNRHALLFKNGTMESP
jgi:hypothetical protein